MSSRSATETAAGTPADRSETVLVGAIIRPHGLRGEVRVEIHSDVSERFAAGAELWAVRGSVRRRLRVGSSRIVRGGALVLFEGCSSREQAEELRGHRLEVEMARVPPAPEGLYYYFELAGCRCFDAAEGDLGVVSEVIEDGGGVLLRVGDGERTLLVPFVEAFLRAVDVEGGRIDLELPPGLVETCASRS